MASGSMSVLSRSNFCNAHQLSRLSIRAPFLLIISSARYYYSNLLFHPDGIGESSFKIFDFYDGDKDLIEYVYLNYIR